MQIPLFNPRGTQLLRNKSKISISILSLAPAIISKVIYKFILVGDLSEIAEVNFLKDM
jgi:hypothetical protein